LLTLGDKHFIINLIFTHQLKNRNLQQHATARNGQKNIPGRSLPFFQAKLSVNTPGDVYEQQADAVAARVMATNDAHIGQNTFFKPGAVAVQRTCQGCENEEQFIHRKESAPQATSAPGGLESYIGSLGSSGQPMSNRSLDFFGPRFGYDFSDVRLHTGKTAAESAQSINAHAYTSGNNIVFNSGKYSPETYSGKGLLAHELAHVVQQRKDIQPYRPKGAFNYGKTEQSFNKATDIETKPWIELITVYLIRRETDAKKHHFWVGQATAEYYKHKLDSINFKVAGGSAGLGLTTAGSFTVSRMEGIGYNSGSHSGDVDMSKREGPNMRYSKDKEMANMHYAVFFHGGEALHIGPLEASSHGCIHVEDMQQINYHSVLGLTKVVIKYSSMGDYPMPDQSAQTA